MKAQGKHESRIWRNWYVVLTAINILILLASALLAGNLPDHVSTNLFVRILLCIDLTIPILVIFFTGGLAAEYNRDLKNC